MEKYPPVRIKQNTACFEGVRPDVKPLQGEGGALGRGGGSGPTGAQPVAGVLGFPGVKVQP